MQFLIPTLVLAQESTPSVKQLMFRVSYYVINPIIILGFVIALLYFIWGILEFLRNRDTNAEKSNEGKQHMLYGTLGMAIMVSAFAILSFLANLIGAGTDITSEIP